MCDVGFFCANFGLPRPLSVLDLGTMYATDRRQTDRRKVYVLLCSVIFVNENENENYQKRKNNDSVNEN